MNQIIPTFTTSRLILKPVTSQDIPSYKKHFVDYEVIQFLSSNVPWPYPEYGVEFSFKKASDIRIFFSLSPFTG